MADRSLNSRAGMSNSTNAATALSSRPSTSPLRQRPLQRASTMADVMVPRPSSQSQRRGSFMTNDSSFSLDRASLKSSTDDLLLPRASRQAAAEQHESSHIHSLPLALALLPAVGGMIIQGANVVLTDVTLLVLATIFLNWSVRLPWEWYTMARAVQVEEGESEEEGYFPNMTKIIEEEPLPIHTDSTSSKPDSTPQPPSSSPSQPTRSPSPSPKPGPSARRTSAATELRLHELLALLTCFLAPLLGAFILHTIRSQLSRPSEGLVSDYNLSIFILAAEFRPLTHLIKMVQSRTLHLQRFVGRNPYLPSPPSPTTVKDLTTRLDELEAHVAAKSTDGVAAGKEPERARVEEKMLQAAARRAVQGDLDALTRAIRRYEKRATLLGLQTEARLNDLDARLRDALTLAAGAERAASQRGLRGLFAGVGEGLAWCVGLPGRVVAWGFGVVWGVGGGVWGWVRGLLGMGSGERERGKKVDRGEKGRGRDGVRERRRAG